MGEKKLFITLRKSVIFSSDRAVAEYADKIWHVKSVDSDDAFEPEQEAKSA